MTYEKYFHSLEWKYRWRHLVALSTLFWMKKMASESFVTICDDFVQQPNKRKKRTPRKRSCYLYTVYIERRAKERDRNDSAKWDARFLHQICVGLQKINSEEYEPSSITISNTKVSTKCRQLYIKKLRRFEAKIYGICYAEFFTERQTKHAAAKILVSYFPINYSYAYNK